MHNSERKELVFCIFRGTFALKLQLQLIAETPHKDKIKRLLWTSYFQDHTFIRAVECAASFPPRFVLYFQNTALGKNGPALHAVK